MSLIMGRPVAVTAVMDTRFAKIEAEDVVDARILFEGGREVRCFASVNSGHHESRFEIRGTGGVIMRPDQVLTKSSAHSAMALRAVNAALPDTCPVSASIIGRALREAGRRLGRKENASLSAHSRLYLDIAARVACGISLPITPEDALASLELCMAIYEAALTGEEVRLPLTAENRVYNGIDKSAYEPHKLPGHARRFTTSV